MAESVNVENSENVGHLEEDYNCWTLSWRFLKFYWKNILLVTWPFICLFIIFANDYPWDSEEGRKFRLLYCITVMVVFWVFELLPLAMTAALPTFMFPFFRVLSSEKTTVCYMTQVAFVFLGSFCATLAIEYSNLHVRMALLMVKIVGANPRKLHYGITTVAFFLSCWVINVPCLAMLCPIIKSILEKLESNGIGTMYRTDEGSNRGFDDRPRPSDFAVCYYMGVCYAVALGGSAVLVGNALNLIMKVLVEKVFGTSDIITFLPWFLFFGPTHLLICLIINTILQFLYMGLFRPKSKDGKMLREAREKIPDAYKSMMDEYNSLGRVTWYETWVIIIYIVLILGWFLRKPGFFPGWSDWLAPDWDRSIHDACVPAIFALVVLFILPVKNTFLNSFSKDPRIRPKMNSASMVTWEQFTSQTPWHMIFVFGGGMSIAYAAREDETNLAKYIGEYMQGFLKKFSPHIVMMLVMLICTILTEFYSSNTILSVLVPGVAHVAVFLRIHPVYLCLPAFSGCVYAFCIPISNPANIYITAFANISTVTMMKTGALVKVVAYVVTSCMFPTYGRLFWDYSQFPEWAENMNIEKRSINNLDPVTENYYDV